MRLRIIQKNPLTMVGTLDRCWLFTFHTLVDDARALLPPPLEPVTYRDYAFWNVVVSHIYKMRPKPLPAIVGMSYWHVAYRLYVRFQPMDGAMPIEGLYFVRSDCDSSLMSAAGNMLTDFNFHTATIRADDRRDEVVVTVDSPGSRGVARLSRREPARLPLDSAFTSLEEAARFLKYKPFGISVDPEQHEANVVRIVRDESAWHSRLVHVEHQQWSMLDNKPVRPEICYEVEPIAYQWNRGTIYQIP